MRNALVILTLLSLPACGLPTFDAGARYGILRPSGEFGISANNTVATADVEGAGFDDDKSVPGATIDFKWGAPHVTISALSASFEGDGRLDAEVSQGGVIIPAGTAVASEMNLGVYSGILTFDLLPTELELGIGAGVTAFDFDATITDRATGQSVSTDETVPVPVLAARAGIELGDFEVAGLLSGTKIHYSDLDTTYYDLDLFARWRFIGGNNRMRGSILLGYRYMDVDFDYDDGDDRVEGDLVLDGPYLGVLFSF